MYGLLTNPWVILGIVIFTITTHVTAYYKGYQSRDNKAKVELAKQTEAKIKAMEAYNLISKELVKAYQQKQVETKIVYRTIKEKVKDETTGRVCFDNGATRLWNNSLEGVLPDTSTRVAETSSTSYTDEVVLQNAIDNFEQYKDCRDQLNALIDWHENN
jgi:hypothetical protein